MTRRRKIWENLGGKIDYCRGEKRFDHVEERTWMKEGEGRFYWRFKRRDFSGSKRYENKSRVIIISLFTMLHVRM